MKKPFLLSSIAAIFLFVSITGIVTSCVSGETEPKVNQQQRVGFSYDYPETYTDWANAYLAGNGKMGVMVFGNPLDETVIFNDRGFNLGQTRERSFAQVSKEDLEKIKELCATGRFAEANELAVKSSQWQGGGEGNRHPGYGMFISIPADGAITDYSRECNYRTGEVTVKWKDNRGKWERKTFVSRKDNVTVQYLTAPDKGKITCSIHLDAHPDMGFPKAMSFDSRIEDGNLNIRAKYFQEKQIGYEGVTRFVVSGGSHSVVDNVLHVTDAKSVTLLTRTAKYYDNCESQWNKKELQQQLSGITADYSKLLKGQKETHQKIYDRVLLDLDASPTERAMTNDELLKLQKQSAEPVKALWERVFDAGRYYYLSSSSELTPPDLLGIWTGNCNAGWGGYYHLDSNLNLQVAGGSIGNMPEAMEGYFHINEVWAPDFRINAQKLLGCRGMVACGNTPGLTSGLMASINNFYPYQYATGEEPWLLYPFWEHYQITGDKDFLRNRLYPLLKDMGEFYEDFLQKKDKDGKFIFAASVSPENQPSNLRVSLLNNSAFDVSGARFALAVLLETCKILNIEQGAGEGVARWSAIYDLLPPYIINEDGAIKEWGWPGLEESYNHRHWSHLLSVTPYQEITPEKEPALFEAARKTLEIKDRYQHGAGHYLLQGALIAANLKDSESLKAKVLRLTKEDFYFSSLATSHNPKHDIFCTDVCNSVPAILMEMLVYSEPGVLELLPALPRELKKGSINGMKARSRLTIEKLSWDKTNNTLECILLSDIDQTLTLIERSGIKEIKGNAEISSSSFGEIARQVSLKAGEQTKLILYVK